MASFHFLDSVLILSMLTGCVVSVPGKDGSSRHVIIGFGIVSVNEAPEKAVIATDTHAFGVSVSDRPGLKFGLGYSSSTVVTVAPHARDVRVEVSKKPWGPLVVDTQRAALKNETKGEGRQHDQKNE
jgi:hypothetical protein